MVRGRKPNAPEIQEQSGAYKKDPQRRNKQAPVMNYSPPPAPESVEDDDVAKAKWDHVCKLLADMGVLATADSDLLEAYCITYSRYRYALQRVLDKGNTVTNAKGGVSRNPECVEMHKSMDRMAKLLSEMGLTPAARARVKSGNNEDNEEDPFEMLARRMSGN